MTCYVVDASVVVKWFVPEVYSVAALRFLNADQELIAPDLLSPEVGNTLWKKVLRREIPAGEAREILRTFNASPIRLYPSGPMLAIAIDLALQERRSVYDSLYLALAIIRECRLVTADRKLLNSFKRPPLADHLLWVED